jgi:hypothetical protein
MKKRSLEIELIEAYNKAKRKFRENEETIEKLSHSLHERRMNGEIISRTDKEEIEFKTALINSSSLYARVDELYHIIFYKTDIYQKCLKDKYTGEIIID